jgi:hypothetical protein
LVNIICDYPQLIGQDLQQPFPFFLNFSQHFSFFFFLAFTSIEIVGAGKVIFNVFFI